MENLENKKELNEVEEENVAGGFDWPSIPDPYSDPAPDFYAAGRPIPSPVDLDKHVKAPVEAPLEAPNKGTHIL